MSKVTKNERISTLERQVAALITLVKMKGYNEPEPQLKQLDQSIFNGLDEKWRFAAIDGERGIVTVFDLRPIPSSCNNYHTNTGEGNYKDLYELTGYDTSNWQNSLIERDIAKELAGSELCKAMLERGDRFVMCFVSGMSDAKADSIPKAITSFNSLTRQFRANHDIWRYAVPINNQGEPLTAAEVGL